MSAKERPPDSDEMDEIEARDRVWTERRLKYRRALYPSNAAQGAFDRHRLLLEVDRLRRIIKDIDPEYGENSRGQW